VTHSVTKTKKPISYESNCCDVTHIHKWNPWQIGN